MRAEILRGMEVEATPFRLHQPVAPSTAIAAACAAEGIAAEEDRVQLRVDAALRELREDAVHAGYAEGLQRAEAEVAAKSRTVVEQAVAEALQTVREQQEHLRVLAQELKAAAPAALAVAEDEMLAACFETLCRMLGEAVVDPARVRFHLIHASAGVAGATAIHVHPQDAAMMQAEGDGAGATWVSDAAIQLGGCVVKAAAGSLDLRLETLLEGCKAALLQARLVRASTAAPSPMGGHE